MSNPKSNGLKFEKEFSNWINTRHDFLIKLPDTRSLRLKSKIVQQISGSRFKELTGTKVPGDFWSLHERTSYLWECKHTGKESLPFDRIAPHQLTGLTAHYNAGGISYIAIGWSNQLCTVISIDEWLLASSELLSNGKKSIKKTYCELIADYVLYRRTPKQLFGEKEARYD